MSFESLEYVRPCKNCGTNGFLEFCDRACKQQYEDTMRKPAEQIRLIRDMELNSSDAECYP